jgi:PAS domain S-box-containing protein
LLQAIIDASPAIIWVKDLKGRFVIVNRQTELMSGFRADQLLGRTSADLFSDEWVDQWWVTDRKVLEEGVSLQLEETAPVGDGVHHILSVKFPLRDETGAVVGLGSIGTDITDQKRGEAEREHLRERLRQSEKLEAIGSLAGGIAHDFNNLLTVISGFAEMARSELAPAAPLRRPLDEILEAAGLGASLTRQLLTFSSRQPIAPEVLGANEAIRSLVAILERLLGAGVRLSCELSPSTCPVLIDRGQFKLILINLAVNARDAMPDGGSLRIRTRIDARDPSRGDPSSSGARPSGGADVASSVPGADVVIEIADTGSGMPPEVRDRVFEPFFTTKEPGKGTGLGLATVYGIVTGAGGSIDCRTELGVGTTFILRLPLAAREPNVGGRREESGTNSAGGRILIVEDNPGVRSLLERMLESAGPRVHSATDGASARRILADRAGGFDLMLTDIVMPGESGASLAAGVQAEYPGLRIGFLSGYPRDVALSDLGRVRGAGFLGKPFTMAEARDFVHRLLSEPMPVAPAVSGGVPSEALPP